jgi:hypothetical protein
LLAVLGKRLPKHIDNQIDPRRGNFSTLKNDALFFGGGSFKVCTGQAADMEFWATARAIYKEMSAMRRIFALVSQHPDFEAASRPHMSAVCIRFRTAALSENDAKQLHATVVERVEKSGKVWISTTELKGKTWFRINPVNFRTRTQHMEELLALLEKDCRAALGVIFQPDRS